MDNTMLDKETEENNVDIEQSQDYIGDNESIARPDNEALARSLGWKPRDEFGGENWVDADKFVELNSKHNGVLKRKISELERKIEGISSHHVKLFERELKKREEEHKQTIAFLKAQKMSAIREGDHATAADLDDQIDVLKEKGPEIPDSPQKTGDWRDNPDVVDFFNENPWITEDDEMKAYAVGKAQLIRSNNPNMSLKEVLNETARNAKRAFPNKFTQRKNMSLSGGDRTGGFINSNKRNYDSMPNDAKEACKEFIRDKYGSKEDYVKMYYSYEDSKSNLLN